MPNIVELAEWDKLANGFWLIIQMQLHEMVITWLILVILCTTNTSWFV